MSDDNHACDEGEGDPVNDDFSTAVADPPTPRKSGAKGNKAAAPKAAQKVVKTKTAAVKEEIEVEPINSDIAHRAAKLFKKLGDETRIHILNTLAQRGETSVGDLCVATDQSQPAVSHHLSLMRESGVVRDRREGKNVMYSLGPPGKVIAKAMNAVIKSLEEK